MSKKTVIKSIHKDDAYYPYRHKFLGQRVSISKTDLDHSCVRNHFGGKLTLRKRIDYLNDGYMENEFYFYAVKLEEVEQ